MTRKLFLMMIMALSILEIKSQCIDCFSKDNDWKYAVGVTLFSNMTYSPSLQIRQPLEFNFKYKLNEKHFLRASVPIAWKTRVYGSPVYPDYPLTEISPEEYVTNMQTEWEYNFNYKTMEYYYTIYGISLGYEYNYPIWNQLSVFSGFDVAYYHQYIFSKYYETDYSQLDQNYTTNLLSLSFNVQKSSKDFYSIKPLIGLHYQFQKLLIEGSIGYYYSKSMNVTDIQSKVWYSNTVTKENSLRYVYPSIFDKLVYNISLYCML